jgi:hypothetical protein
MTPRRANAGASELCIVPGCVRARHPWRSRAGACGMHFQRMYRHGTYELPELCNVLGCTKARVARGMCQMHYRRMPRPEPRPKPPPGGITPQGYIVLYRQHDHPLRRRRHPYVLAHRAALYDVLGPGGHACRWCGRTVFWEKPPKHRDALVVDHLDGNRVNNATDNLVPSCQPCNSARHTHQPLVGLLRIRQITELARVPIGTVRYWRREGLLVDRGRAPDGSSLFFAEDVRQLLARRRADERVGRGNKAVVNGHSFSGEDTEPDWVTEHDASQVEEGASHDVPF